PGKAVGHSGSDGSGSEPITYYNCLASERASERPSERDRATSSTLQRGFNPGEPRNNHLPAIHPFASRSLLLLESFAVWPGINVCRSPCLAFPSCQYLLTSQSLSPFSSHIRRHLKTASPRRVYSYSPRISRNTRTRHAFRIRPYFFLYLPHTS
ncbi:hypothetical protein WH47_08993, partial [Habropoda laboriosa]